MNRTSRSTKVKAFLVLLWVVFTFSLVAWWWVFSLTRLPLSESLHRMFLWEGSILLAAIVLGGISLLFFIYQDHRRHNRLRFFFSTFNHDLKTSMARLRLQAEVLDEELAHLKSPILQRMVQDISRLELQLENSLLIANMERHPFYIEQFKLSQIIQGLRGDFNDLKIEINQDAKVFADKRALLSIFKNIFQNSLIHGKAERVHIQVQPQDKNLSIQISDNGQGFQGDLSRLGSEILQSQDARGNGLGLLLAKNLIQGMNGRIEFRPGPEGFAVHIQLPGSAL